MSNDFVNISDPDAVRANAVRLSAAGETLDGEAQSQVSAIEAIEGEAPWGGDKYGAAFLKGYEQQPQGGGAQANSSVQESLDQLGPEATKIGDAVTQAMVDYDAADTANASDINSVR
jgi:hypothetical protein